MNKTIVGTHDGYDVPLLKTTQTGYAYSNYGIVCGVAFRRKDAIRDIEERTGEPWSVCRHCWEVWKCKVEPL